MQILVQFPEEGYFKGTQKSVLLLSEIWKGELNYAVKFILKICAAYGDAWHRRLKS